ncbi:MAG: hypothetical protein V4514_21895 [Pseudomonadota bacterium]|uniref:hypothetical protein n=1 Tax=unclassified Phenylobacterium TaxID=2640670 RepID=UPI000AE8ECA9|nr:MULTISPECIES: hypothetical protein [unclassified Phenylobacterium]MBT9473266.1 hypothetical protein [Phenylobacterium sp.]
MRTATVMLVSALALSLAACNGPAQPAAAPKDASAEAPPAAEAPAPAPAAVTLPTVDTAAVQARLTPDNTLEALTFEAAGSTTASGAIKGYKAPVYAVPVAAGQTLTVAFKPSNTSQYMNVTDAADTTGAAVHRGEVDGADASLTAAKDTIYLLQPFMVRAAARRGESGTFEISVTRK